MNRKDALNEQWRLNKETNIMERVDQFPTFKEMIQHLIQWMGDDPEREGLKETPTRVLASWYEMFAGYRTDPKQYFKTFEESSDEMVVVDHLEFFSTCEHHMLPFFGEVHVGYLPNGKVIGASKIPRIVDCFAKRLQIQERLTNQIAQCLQTGLNPLGVGVVMKAKHLCMCARGVGKQHSQMKTSALLGKFRSIEVRQEFLRLISI